MCKLCGKSSPLRRIYTHYRLYHANAKTSPLPCFYDNCAVTFTNLSSLSSHLSCCHKSHRTSKRNFEGDKFRCNVCHHLSTTGKSLLSHLREHLKGHQVVVCPFKNCCFESRNVKTFNSHIHKRHFTSLQEVKVDNEQVNEIENSVIYSDEDNQVLVSENVNNYEQYQLDKGEYRQKLLEKSSLLFLDLETICKVPSKTVKKITSGLLDIHDLSAPILFDAVASVTEQYEISPCIAE